MNAKVDKIAEDISKYGITRDASPSHKRIAKALRIAARAIDEEVWRTSEETGRHFQIETSSGQITKGFGGRLNGVKVSPMGSGFSSEKTTQPNPSSPVGYGNAPNPAQSAPSDPSVPAGNGNGGEGENTQLASKRPNSKKPNAPSKKPNAPPKKPNAKKKKDPHKKPDPNGKKNANNPMESLAKLENLLKKLQSQFSKVENEARSESQFASREAKKKGNNTNTENENKQMNSFANTGLQENPYANSYGQNSSLT